MALHLLAYELLLNIVSNLHYKDLQPFLQCNKNLFAKSNQKAFWKDLCMMKGIRYRCPDISWRELYKSESVHTMCPHIHPRGFEDKKKQFWPLFNQQDTTCPIMYCLYPSCEFLGTDEQFAKHVHPVALTLSPLHIFDVWCDTCSKLISLNKNDNISYGVRSERYVLEKLLKDLGSLTKEKAVDQQIVQGRRAIERRVYSLQTRLIPVNIIRRDWYLSWLDFITGRSYDLPGCLDNTVLLKEGRLDPTIALGQHFEVISDKLKHYIEKFYSPKGSFVSLVNLQGDPTYCKLVHKIKIRHQIQRVALTPSDILLEQP
ncbi:hypothetical protein BY458DRAFT_527168 [Sporodiniella umbellata]|nr:hypothetical protein BY458DRAFT_527168 [Sporodiniella umbellata]